MNKHILKKCHVALWLQEMTLYSFILFIYFFTVQREEWHLITKNLEIVIALTLTRKGYFFGGGVSKSICNNISSYS